MIQRVLPDYAGGSIANLAASVLRAYGADAPVSPCRADLLPPDLLSSRSGIVLFICDALGINQLRFALEAISLPSLNRLATGEFGLRQLTSVFPSTTTAALTTLHTATTPSLHGVLGHRQWMDEVGALCDMLRFRTMLQPTVAFDEDVAAAVPSTCQRLGTVGVRSYNVSATAYAGSGFSALLNRGSEFLGYQSLAEIPHLIDSSIDRKESSFHCAYWAMVDTLAHIYGARSGSISINPSLLELSLIDRVIAELIKVCDHHDRVLVVVADHGQTNLTPDRALPVDGEVATMLRHPPGGGRRALYLTTDDPETLATSPLLQELDVELVPAAVALRDGWFGPGGERFESRLGNLILLASSDRQLLFDYGSGLHVNLGAHGGLSSDEMLVPLLVHH